MPDRMVRDEILDSDRYWSVDSDTQRMMFLHFLLLADDYGNTEATPALIRRRVFGAGLHPEGQHPGANSARLSDDVIAKLLDGMVKADLIRLYVVNGKRYVHIPRFRQRLRAYKRSNPRPPSDIECTEISELTEKMRADVSHMSVTCQTRAVEGRKEVKEVKTTRARPEAVDNFGGKNGGKDSPTESKPAALNGGKVPKPPAGWRSDPNTAARYGEQLGVRAHRSESLAAYVARIDVTLQAMRARSRSSNGDH